jgi:hypothetical protein
MRSPSEEIDLERIVQLQYVVSATDDHIPPWHQTFKVNALVCGPKRCVLSSSGHILGIVNPPVNPPKRDACPRVLPVLMVVKAVYVAPVENRGIYGGGTVARVIDGRDLLPPEPMELTLAALDELAPDDELVLLLYCQPQPLYGILRRNGYGWTEQIRADGTREIHIRKTS